MARPLLLFLVVLLTWASLASAEHRLWFRYVVLGYVTDADGRPLPGQPVELTRDKTGFSYLAETDAKGFYVVVARLGDESAGESLTLKIGRVAVRITARFDPKNHADDRGTRVDLVGGKPIERVAWFPSTLRLFLRPK